MPDNPIMDRRRKFLRDLIKSYMGDPNQAEQYLAMWVKGRLRQKDLEMIIARDHGMTSDEIAEQFGYSNAAHALSAIQAARHKVSDEQRGTR